MLQVRAVQRVRVEKDRDGLVKRDAVLVRVGLRLPRIPLKHEFSIYVMSPTVSGGVVLGGQSRRFSTRVSSRGDTKCLSLGVISSVIAVAHAANRGERAQLGAKRGESDGVRWRFHGRTRISFIERTAARR